MTRREWEPCLLRKSIFQLPNNVFPAFDCDMPRSWSLAKMRLQFAIPASRKCGSSCMSHGVEVEYELGRKGCLTGSVKSLSLDSKSLTKLDQESACDVWRAQGHMARVRQAGVISG